MLTQAEWKQIYTAIMAMQSLHLVGQFDMGDVVNRNNVLCIVKNYVEPEKDKEPCKTD